MPGKVTGMKMRLPYLALSPRRAFVPPRPPAQRAPPPPLQEQPGPGGPQGPETPQDQPAPPAPHGLPGVDPHEGLVTPPDQLPKVQRGERTHNLDFLFGALKVAPRELAATEARTLLGPVGRQPATRPRTS